MKLNKKYIFAVLIFILSVLAVFYIYNKKIVMGESILPFLKAWTLEDVVKEALTKSDPNICEKINKAFVLQDLKINVKEARETCKSTYAVEKTDLKYCMTLSEISSKGDLSSKDICLSGLAKKTKNTALCDLLNNKSYIRLCKDFVWGDI